jgi:hypothetical protein
MNTPLHGRIHEVFQDKRQILVDGARTHWRLYLAKHGVGAVIYKQLPGKDQEFVQALGSYYAGYIYEGADGHLYFEGCEADGETEFTSSAIPGWTTTRGTW